MARWVDCDGAEDWTGWVGHRLEPRAHESTDHEPTSREISTGSEPGGRMSTDGLTVAGTLTDTGGSLTLAVSSGTATWGDVSMSVSPATALLPAVATTVQ